MKDNLIEFYVNKFYFLDCADNIDISYISPILRRKTSLLDKITLTAINKVFSDSVKNIVFSSKTGELERLLKIIEQYTLDKEVSPNTFSASVHNYPVGFYLLNIKKPLKYTALSGANNSITSGFLSSLISKYDNIIYCYSDVKDNNIEAFSVNFSKKPMNNSSKCVLTFKNNDELKDNFSDFIKFFNKETNYLETSLYKIERTS